MNIEIIAPTLEEAIAQGLAQLGLTREQVDVEVLDAGSKGFLGLGGRQVRVRLTVKEAPAASPAAPAEPQPAAAQPSVASAPAAAEEDADPVLALTRKTIRDLLRLMKVEGEVSVRYGQPEDGEEQTPVLVDIHGKDLSILIGRRAETLSALQYVVGLIVGKEAGHYTQIIIDVEGYRGRRERALRQLARRMAEQAIRSGRRQVLEPMSPAERRIVHLELRGHPEVDTISVGEEPNRKVTIVPK
ncbi:MAG: RNA-binding cell elongation regulator Jag/EloR [Anaerolineales bacterium]